MKELNTSFHHHHARHGHHHRFPHHQQHANMSILFPWPENRTPSERFIFMSSSASSSSSVTPSSSWVSAEPLTSSSAAKTVTESVLRLLSTRAVNDDEESFLDGNSTLRDIFVTTTPYGTDVTTSGLNNISAEAHVSSTIAEEFKKLWYPILVPLMLLFCALSSVINLLIVFSVRWCRKPMTPTLYFSISLALADAFASIVIGLGLIVNSLLPYVYGYKIQNHCFTLTLEAFRLGGVVVAVTHLMALAINHWIGIVRPLQYEATMTRGTALRVIIASWISPILILLLYFCSVQDQGFQSSNCSNCDFMKKLTFRMIFASFFFAPLAIMTFIYWHIFIIVRSHIHYRRKYENCQQLRRNVKAVVTTVLILGTYIVGWMPGILWYILVCDNCMYLLNDVSLELRIPINMVINTLIIMKAVVDPIIYAARMADIQIALRKMRYEFFLWIFESCAPPRPPPLDTLEMGSVRFTKSFRMSSRGSSSRSHV